MANLPYLSEPCQAPTQIATTLGSANLATLTGGQLTTVPALSSDQTNWYFNFIDPGYQDYYDWTPDSDGDGSGTSTGAGGTTTPPVPVALPGPILATPPNGTTSTPMSGVGAAPAPGGSSSAPAAATGAASSASSGATGAPVSPVTVVINVPAPMSAPIPSAPASGATATGASPSPAAPAAPASPSPTPQPSPPSSSPSAPQPPSVPQPASVAQLPMTAAQGSPTAASAPSAASSAPISVAGTQAAAPVVPAALAPVAPAPQAIGAPVTPDPIVSAISYNPRFRESKARGGHDSVFEEMLDEENVTLRMVTRDASPLPFAVPPGCDSVDFSFGPLEVNADAGSDEDLDHFIMLDTPQIQHDGQTEEGSALGTLTPGSALLVTIPWRAPSFVTLGANHLRATVYAHFYARVQPLTDDT